MPNARPSGKALNVPAAKDCGCPQDGPRGLSRRGFLGAAAAAGTLGAVSTVVGDFGSMQLAYADAGYTGDVLVVISLRGGFDGLSAIVPAADPNYLAARPTIGIPTSRLIPLTSTFGLHPALNKLKPLWDAGLFGVVHAVGQADPTRSHFDAMDQMERAAPGSSLRTGWINRMVGLSGPGSTFAQSSLSTSTAPSSFLGPAPSITLGSIDSFGLDGSGDAADRARWSKTLRTMYRGQHQIVLGPAMATLNAIGATSAMKSAGYRPANGAQYPDGLGRALRDVARMIKAGVGLRVVAIDMGNWDMHDGLGRSDGGWMFRQLTELGSALAAFATDIGPGMPGVNVVTLSEFGRRVQENGSGGVDHGHGNAVFLLGGGVAGGQVLGRWPGLAPSALDDGDLAGTTDYRTILAELLEKRGGLGGAKVFPGVSKDRVGIVKSR
ncbi:MAG: hypothetical protein QOJ11_2945 [Frankiales bacterium]|jgi:uncharacterized protein (DUF1501 family)|nr:hypothetical protein [Frankiales bacterium]